MSPREATSLTPEPLPVLVPGRAEGVLTGGNLTMLAAGCGTTLSRRRRRVAGGAGGRRGGAVPTRPGLTQLLRSGWFDGVRGIVLGTFTDCGPAAMVREVLIDRLVPLEVPTVVNAPVGHGPRNLAVPLGVRAVLDAAETGTLVLSGPAVR